MSIQRLNFNALSNGGDNPSDAFRKLDGNCVDLDNRLNVVQKSVDSANSGMSNAGIYAPSPTTDVDVNNKPLGTMTSYLTTTWGGLQPDSSGQIYGHFNVISLGTGGASLAPGVRKSIVALEAFNNGPAWPRMWIRAFHDTSASPFAEVHTT